MRWDIIGDIRDAETIAAGRRLKALRVATVGRQMYIATKRLLDDT